ncbi:TerB family tellurite resistance protein, partial [Streptomyces asiaticus]
PAGHGAVALEISDEAGAPVVSVGSLAPHLAPTGREAILLQGARIAVADGPYRPAERAVLETVGRALMICPDDTARLLAATRAAF